MEPPINSEDTQPLQQIDIPRIPEAAVTSGGAFVSIPNDQTNCDRGFIDPKLGIAMVCDGVGRTGLWGAIAAELTTRFSQSHIKQPFTSRDEFTRTAFDIWNLSNVHFEQFIHYLDSYLRVDSNKSVGDIFKDTEENPIWKSLISESTRNFVRDLVIPLQDNKFREERASLNKLVEYMNTAAAFAAIIQDGDTTMLAIAHSGDTRVYTIEETGNEMLVRPVTTDHNLAYQIFGGDSPITAYINTVLAETPSDEFTSEQHVEFTKVLNKHLQPNQHIELLNSLNELTKRKYKKISLYPFWENRNFITQSVRYDIPDITFVPLTPATRAVMIVSDALPDNMHHQQLQQEVNAIDWDKDNPQQYAQEVATVLTDRAKQLENDLQNDRASHDDGYTAAVMVVKR